ncbi:MAG: alcohol dehydrogenase catalytic domain-containing protein [bacterium]|nr:alcohol dehydrogenase catalytic domain-containing protein [bacterium]
MATSAYIKAPWRCELRQVELPADPPPGQILLRVKACGICGSDLFTAQTAPDWKAFGHEIAGRIEKLGPGVEGLEAGQAVVLESASFCGRCALCRNGRVDLCNKAPNFWKQPAMGFSDFMLAPAAAAVPYRGLDPQVASLAEPAGVAYDMVKTAGIALGERVCVVGPGPIGLMAVSLARFSGASRLVCVGRAGHDNRLAAARTLGAEILATDTPLDQLPQLRRAFDHVLMTAPVPFIPPALALLAYDGRLTYIGTGVGEATIAFDANDFHFRKLQLRASFASPAVYLPRVLNLLAQGTIPGRALISHVFPLADIGQALALCRDHKTETIKVVIAP